MVYGMKVNNNAILHGGMANSLFLLPPVEVLCLMVIFIILETLLGGPAARKIAFRIVNQKKHRPLFVILAVQVMAVCSCALLLQNGCRP